MIIGSIAGVAFTQRVTWRWFLRIKLFLSAITILIIVFFFKTPPEDSSEALSILEKFKSLDLLGFLVFTPAIIMILLVLQ